jgi:proton glutamate symport protein
MTIEPKSARSHEVRTRGLGLLPLYGLALLSAGIALFPIFGIHWWLTVARWAGLVCLVAHGLRKGSLTYWILLAMLLGGEIGFDTPGFAAHLRFLSDIFLRLIKVIVAPLILGSLISGIARHGDFRRLGRISIKTLVYFEIVTTAALLIGLVAIDITRVGERLSVHPVAAFSSPPAPSLRWDEFLVSIFPENLAQSIANQQILQVAIFAVLFGIALSCLPEAGRAPILNFCKSLTQTMFVFTNIVMYFAPIGIGAAMAYALSQMGAGALFSLAKFVLTAYGAFVAFILGVLLPIALWARLPLRRFLSAVAEPVSIGFATSTSEAALPRAMEQMESFGVPEEVVSFVIPLGYSFNMDGSTIYLAVASMFVAQASGVQMHWTRQLAMVLTLMLTSKGMAGVPRVVLVILTATASMFHLSSEPILLIVGVDALIDMGRTAVNVLGNCLCSAVVARWEGVLAIDSSEPGTTTALRY